MKTKDHHALAKKLAENKNMTGWQKAAFFFGNIEPDYNRFSYLGTNVEYFARGHSFRCRKKQIYRFLNQPYSKSLLWWFRAGRVFHYLTDSFSRPHNPEFGYRSQEHVEYEIALHHVVKRHMKEESWEVPKVDSDLKHWLEQRHRRYMRRTRGTQEDSYYILTTVTAVWNWMMGELAGC